MACLSYVSEWRTEARKITIKASGYRTECPYSYHHENMFFSVSVLLCRIYYTEETSGRLWRMLENNIKMKFKE